MPSSGARKISLRDGAGRSPRSSLCDNGNPEAFPVYGFFLFFLSRQGKQKTLEGKLRFCGTSGPGRSGGAQFGVSRKRKKKISPCRGCFPCSGICRRKMSFSAFVRKTGGGVPVSHCGRGGEKYGSVSLFSSQTQIPRSIQKECSSLKKEMAPGSEENQKKKESGMVRRCSARTFFIPVKWE